LEILLEIGNYLSCVAFSEAGEIGNFLTHDGNILKNTQLLIPNKK
jgi:hypothetical protein